MLLMNLIKVLCLSINNYQFCTSFTITYMYMYMSVLEVVAPLSHSLTELLVIVVHVLHKPFFPLPHCQGIFGVGQSTAKFINKETNIKTKFV